jgi:hypothetical protein
VSAIVLAALVVMWAVVLVPMFLKRSERSQEMAGPARFAGAMRVLSRRRRTPELPADQRRAAVISAALGAAPTRPVRPAMSPARLAARRSARVAARRRGLAVMGAALLLSLLAAVLVAGWVWIVQGAVDVFVVAGFAQLRASALADRASLGLPRAPMRPATRVADMAQTAAPRAVSTPAVRRDKHLIFDAVTGAPIVSRPRVAPAVAAATASTRASRPVATSASLSVSAPVSMPASMPASMPDDYYDAPTAPPQPERVRVPLLDPVDTDPDTLTDGIELLDGILSRASGQ